MSSAVIFVAAIMVVVGGVSAIGSIFVSAAGGDRRLCFAAFFLGAPALLLGCGLIHALS